MIKRPQMYFCGIVLAGFFLLYFIDWVACGKLIGYTAATCVDPLVIIAAIATIFIGSTYRQFISSALVIGVLLAVFEGFATYKWQSEHGMASHPSMYLMPVFAVVLLGNIIAMFQINRFSVMKKTDSTIKPV